MLILLVQGAIAISCFIPWDHSFAHYAHSRGDHRAYACVETCVEKDAVSVS